VTYILAVISSEMRQEIVKEFLAVRVKDEANQVLYMTMSSPLVPSHPRCYCDLIVYVVVSLAEALWPFFSSSSAL